MIREELCIRACKYAIGELTRKGSVAFITAEHESKQQISWVEVVEWLNALEQDPVIDKIKAEIKQIADEEQKHDKKWANGLRYAIKIIDKYKAESEEKV